MIPSALQIWTKSLTGLFIYLEEAQCWPLRRDRLLSEPGPPWNVGCT